MKTHREQLLERLSNFRTVPGHGPDISKMTDDELERYVKLLESMFEDAYEDDHEDNDDI